MTTIVDANILVAVGDPDDARHEAATHWLETTHDRLVLPQAIVCEIDHLLLRSAPAPARSAFLGDMAAQRFTTFCLEPADWRLAVELADRYADLAPGLSDLSIVIAADRHDTTRVATFDQRHFRVMTSIGGRPFTLIPLDTDGVAEGTQT